MYILNKLGKFLNNADSAAVKYIKHSLECVILSSLLLVTYILSLKSTSDLSYFELMERAECLQSSVICSLIIAVSLGMLADFVIKHDNLRKDNHRS